MIRIDVVGLPAPKGSKSAFIVGKPGALRAIVTDKPAHGNRSLNPWKMAVTSAIQGAIGNYVIRHEEGWIPLDGPLRVIIDFHLPRPATAPKRTRFPAKKPDIDKLTRHVFDLCSKVLWSDDARIVTVIARKRFAEGRPPGMTMQVDLESPPQTAA